jgi:hypothetical protein
MPRRERNRGQTRFAESSLELHALIGIYAVADKLAFKVIEV